MVALTPVGPDRIKARMLLRLIAQQLPDAIVSHDERTQTLVLDTTSKDAWEALEAAGEQLDLNWDQHLAYKKR